VRVAIIGLGLIGGSIGLALRQSPKSEWNLTAYVRRPEVASKALSYGIADRVETDLGATVREAELVIIATPVLTIKDVMRQIAGYLPSGCVVTDTASTKVQVMKWAGEILPSTVDFVGGHPMAGRETYGIEAARADLFRGCTYCLTPADNASKSAVEKVVGLVEKLGARPYFIDAWQHDELVAAVSHLPLVLSAALVSVTTNDPAWGRMSQLAASGYRDLTRLASGNPEVNAHICLSNRDAILRWIDKFIKELKRYRDIIDSSSDSVLQQALTEANKARETWLNRT